MEQRGLSSSVGEQQVPLSVGFGMPGLFSRTPASTWVHEPLHI